MDSGISVIHMFASASFLVQAVLVTLIFASVLSWAIIIQKTRLLRRVEGDFLDFEQLVWDATRQQSLDTLFSDAQKYTTKKNTYGIREVFVDGYGVYRHYRDTAHVHEHAQRIMLVTTNRIYAVWQENLTALATIGSTSPYIGLLGTVWGIMHAFQALGTLKQATIAMVAPGISEALIATAIGLFAAIPAVIAFNIISQRIEKMREQFENFIEEFSVVLGDLNDLS